MASCISLPVFAGAFENALNNNNNVFLYLYTPQCRYCNMFNPVYQKLSNNYKGKCSFLKIDATTPYGASLMKQFRSYYVPFVVVAQKDKDSYINITADCLVDYVCTANTLDKIIK